MLNRLEFIEKLYNGLSVTEACKKVGITNPTGYEWLKKWNGRGYFGLFPEYNYQKNVFDENDYTVINLELLKIKKVTVNNTKEIIIDNFGRTLSDSQIRNILKKLDYEYKQLLEEYQKKDNSTS